MSRGASFALLVEADAKAARVIRDNIVALRVGPSTRLVTGKVVQALSGPPDGEPFDVVFADPPYGHGLGEQALASALAGGWLRPGALAVLEERGDVVVAPIVGFTVLERRDVGDSQVVLLKVQTRSGA